jgi:hypothetical protein
MDTTVSKPELVSDAADSREEDVRSRVVGSAQT